MAKYLKKFNNHAEYEAYSADTENFILPNVSWCVAQDDVHYNPYVPDYSSEYLTFVAKEDGTFKFSGATTAHTLSYSLDNGTNWTTLASNTDSPTVNSGNKIIWKGELVPQSSKGIGKFSSSGSFEAQGTPMSLLYGDNFKGQTSLQGKTYAFYKLFNGCTKLESAENLSLPATTLANSCYYGMFWSCTSLTTAPELPATTLVLYCYQNMFKGCTSLTTAPLLPATTLGRYCYQGMFMGCTSLTTAPDLLADKLEGYCYSSMFNGCTSLTTAPKIEATKSVANTSGHCSSMFSGCTSLTTAPELHMTALKSRCYECMFGGCTSLTTAPELPATTLAEFCYSRMFMGCTNLVKAPNILSDALVSSCYYGMFSDCTSLTTAPELPATTLAQYCYQGMFSGCTSLTTAPELPATTLKTYCYSYMFKGCTKLNYVKCLATERTGTYGTIDWLVGVASKGTFVKASSTEWASDTSAIPPDWTIQDAS